MCWRIGLTVGTPAEIAERSGKVADTKVAIAVIAVPMAFHGYSPTVSDPFRAPCDTCSESSSSGFWTGGELRTAFSDEVGPCLNVVLLLLGEMPSVARR